LDLRGRKGQVGRGKLHNKEHVAYMREMRNGYSILIGKPEGKRPLGMGR
jgi:hypothetical protein